MKLSPRASLLLVALGACHTKDTAPSPESTTLVGRWQLTRLDCYCPAGPVPNEVLLLKEDSTFTLTIDNQQLNTGRYFTGQGTLCGSASQQALLTTAGYSSNSAYFRDGAYTVSSNQLVLKQGSPCIADVLVRTYRRIP